MSNNDNIDEILGIEPKDYGTKVMKLVDVNEAKTKLQQMLVEARIEELSTVKSWQLSDPWRTEYMEDYLRHRHDELKSQLKERK